MHILKPLKVAGLIGVLAMSACAYKKRLLVNPTAVIPSAASSADVSKAVRVALGKYGWTIDQEETGSTKAHLQKDDLFASIQVDFNDKQATVRHLESKNFHYKKISANEERIHSHYLVWANNIARQLQQELNSIHP